MNTSFLDSTPDRIGWMLLHSVWQFTVISAVLLLLLTLFRRRSPQFRYLLECGALTAMLLCSVGTFIGAEVPARPQAGFSRPAYEPAITASRTAADGLQPAAQSSNTRRPPAGTTQDIVHMPVFPPPLDSDRHSPAATLPTTPPNSVFGHHAAVEFLQPWLNPICAAWLIGATLLSCRLFFGLHGTRRLRSQETRTVPPEIIALCRTLCRQIGLRRSVAVLQSNLVDGPTLIGWLSPVVLLPAGTLTGLTPPQLQAVILHELAHVRRHDYLINALQIVIETLFFYHPAVWWISRRLRIEREECCDDLTVRLTGDRIGYARMLLWLDEHRTSIRPRAYTLSASGGSLRDRVRRLLIPQPSLNQGGGMALMAAIGAGILCGGSILITAAADSVSPRIETNPALSAQERSPETDTAGESAPAAAPVAPQPLVDTRLPESGTVYDLRFSSDGRRLTTIAYGPGPAADGRYRRVRMWDTRTRKILREVPLEWKTQWTHFSRETILTPDARNVIAGLGENLGIWDAETGAFQRTLETQWDGFGQLSLRHLATDRTGQYVACSGITNRLGLLHSGYLFVWNLQTGELVQSITSENAGDIQSMAFSKDGRHIAAWPAPGGVGIWDVRNGEQTSAFPNKNPPESAPFEQFTSGVIDQVLGMQFSHDGKTLAISDPVGVKLINVETQQVFTQISAPFRYNSPRFQFSPDDRRLVRYGVHLKEARETLLWETRSGQLIATYDGEATAVAFSKNGNQLAIGGSDSAQAVMICPQSVDGTAVSRAHNRNSTPDSPAASATGDYKTVLWAEQFGPEWTTGVRVEQTPTADAPPFWFCNTCCGMKRTARCTPASASVAARVTIPCLRTG